jgi:propanol-preferring alcohol dehydrogenase
MARSNAGNPLKHWRTRSAAVRAGSSNERAPGELDAAIVFAPVGSLVPAALRVIRKGGIVVCGGIQMSDIPTFPYSILWEERCLVNVANLTRRARGSACRLRPWPVYAHT